MHPGKKLKEALAKQRASDGARRVRHDLGEDCRPAGFRRALHDRIRRLRLARAARTPALVSYTEMVGRVAQICQGTHDAGDLRRRYRLRRPPQRRAHGQGLRGCRRRRHPARGSGVPQAMRAHARPARGARRGHGAQDRGGGGKPRLARFPDRGPHRRAHQPRPRRGAAAGGGLCRRPAPTSSSSRARRARRRWPGSAGSFDLPLLANMADGGRTPILAERAAGGTRLQARHLSGDRLSRHRQGARACLWRAAREGLERHARRPISIRSTSSAA